MAGQAERLPETDPGLDPIGDAAELLGERHVPSRVLQGSRDVSAQRVGHAAEHMCDITVEVVALARELESPIRVRDRLGDLPEIDPCPGASRVAQRLLVEAHERRGRDIDHPLEDRAADVLADHGGGLEHAPLALRQSVDARGQERLHGVRHRELLHLCHQPVAAALAREMARLDQRPHDFLGEEGVSAGSLMDQARESRRAPLRAEQILEQLADRLGAERRQRELLDV
jgi:hypothetical protein